MNLDDDFDLDEHGLTLRPWGESRARRMIVSLMQTVAIGLPLFLFWYF